MKIRRLIVYEGKFEDLVNQLASSLHGTKPGIGSCKITAYTLPGFSWSWKTLKQIVKAIMDKGE